MIQQMYIVVSGEFEMTRLNKNQYTLINPIKSDKLGDAKNLDSQVLANLLKKHNSRKLILS